jgi:hypothetical protein
MAKTWVEVRTFDSSNNFTQANDPTAAIACEVLARRIVHIAEPDRIATILSKRYQHRQIDGDESEMASALEVAIDQHW